MPEGIVKPAVLNVSEVPPLPETTIATAYAHTLEWMRIRVATSQDLRNAVADLERFTGEIGELNHFLKGGDRLMGRIETKISENLIDPSDAAALKAALVCRVKRSILNIIQADEETPWVVVKERLKKAYGGGRWTPEEDIFQMFRETKQARQSNGQYAGVLLARYNKIQEKMRETHSVEEAEARMAFLSTIWKVQLAKETGKKEGLPRDRTFLECAQDMVDASARDEEEKITEEDTSWSRVTYRRPNNLRVPRREVEIPRRRERTTPVAWKTGRPRNNGRREERKCHGCGKTGHLVAHCPRTKCFECGTEGHIARQCPYMSRRRETTKDEPMEVNAQKLWRRNRTSVASTSSSATSESEEETVEQIGRAHV